MLRNQGINKEITSIRENTKLLFLNEKMNEDRTMFSWHNLRAN